jgi:hypothetical protein
MNMQELNILLCFVNAFIFGGLFYRSMRCTDGIGLTFIRVLTGLQMLLGLYLGAMRALFYTNVISDNVFLDYTFLSILISTLTGVYLIFIIEENSYLK